MRRKKTRHKWGKKAVLCNSLLLFVAGMLHNWGEKRDLRSTLDSLNHQVATELYASDAARRIWSGFPRSEFHRQYARLPFFPSRSVWKVTDGGLRFWKVAEGGLHSNHCWGTAWTPHGSLHRDVFPRASRLSAARRWHPNNPAVMNDVCPPRLTHDEPVTFPHCASRAAFYSWLGSIRHLNASRDENASAHDAWKQGGFDKKELRRGTGWS